MISAVRPSQSNNSALRRYHTIVSLFWRASERVPGVCLGRVMTRRERYSLLEKWRGHLVCVCVRVSSRVAWPLYIYFVVIRQTTMLGRSLVAVAWPVFGLRLDGTTLRHGK